MEYNQDFIHQFASVYPEDFVKFIALGLWAAQSEDHGRELVYMDEELLVFKVKPE